MVSHNLTQRPKSRCSQRYILWIQVCTWCAHSACATLYITGKRKTLNEVGANYSNPNTMDQTSSYKCQVGLSQGATDSVISCFMFVGSLSSVQVVSSVVINTRHSALEVGHKSISRSSVSCANVTSLFRAR